jgi:predicted dehydrogenase
VPEPLRLALSGCGRIAERGYVPAIAAAESVVLAAVADPEIARCTAVAPDAPAFRSLDDLLVEGGIDAVVVASPPGRHLADAAAAARVGLPALVEKPPGRDAEEAARLADLEPAPWLALNRRFDRRLDRLALPPGGTLRCTFTTAWDAHEPEGDLLLDLGPHLVDLALRVGGEVGRVDARMDGTAWQLRLELERGSAELSVGAGAYTERYETLDANGRHVSGYEAGRLVERVRDRLRPTAERPLAASIARQLEAFAAAVRGDDPGPLAPAHEGVAIMAVLDAARVSAGRDGAAVGLV